MFVRSISGAAIAAALLLGTSAQACNVKQAAPGVINLSVGSAGCGSNAAQVAKMAQSLKAAIAAMPPAESGNRRGGANLVQRSSAGNKLYKIADMRDQARFLSGQPKGSGYYNYPGGKR